MPAVEMVPLHLLVEKEIGYGFSTYILTILYVMLHKGLCRWFCSNHDISYDASEFLQPLIIAVEENETVLNDTPDKLGIPVVTFLVCYIFDFVMYLEINEIEKNYVWKEFISSN